MSIILAIDPGPVESGWVVYDAGRVISSGIWPNVKLLEHLYRKPSGQILAIEMIASYGMAVGKEVFETCVWIGRFQQAWFDPEAVRLIYRMQVKMHLCHNTKAKGSEIRQALIDLLGAPGIKANPGPCYGVKSHAWSALAVAVTADAMASPDAIAPGLFAPPKAAKAPDAEFFA